MSLRSALLSLVATPDRAWLTLLAGVLLIARELAAPGRIFPGILGAVGVFTAASALSEYRIAHLGGAALFFSLILIALQSLRRLFWLPAIGAACLMAAGARTLILPPWQISWQAAAAGVPVAILMCVLGRTAVRGYRNKTSW